MKLTDHYDGSNNAFEGDQTLQWRSLPANALVSKATVKVTPTKAADGTLFEEVISFANGQGNLGATKNPGDTFVEVDFHKRRTLAAVTGPNVANANLQVDMGGVYVEINDRGAIRATGDNLFQVPSGGTLPGLTVSKFRLIAPAGSATPDVSTVTIRSVPSNLTVRLGKFPPVWARLGELTAAETSPDFSVILQTFLASATPVNGFYLVPALIHSDTVCRLDVDIEVEYVVQVSLQPPGVKEVVLPYDFGTVAKSDPSVLNVALPANTQIVPGGSAARVRGAFDDTRIAFGPTGSVTPADQAGVSPAESQAQILSLDSALAATGIDLLLSAVSRTASLTLDLRGDVDGKPDLASLLPAPAQFTLDGTVQGQSTWTSVPLPSEFHFQDHTQKRYWVVLECLDGQSTWGVQAAPPGAVPLQHTQDGGLSWRDTPSSKVAGALAAFLRLRNKPDRFQVPIDLQVGTGDQAVRVKLDRFQPLGRVDFALDPSDLAGAFNQYAAKALPAACPQGEQLANGDFSQWTVVGSDPGTPGNIDLGTTPVAVTVSPDGRSAYVLTRGDNSDLTPRLNIVDVTCDEAKSSLQLNKLKGDTGQEVAVHPDGSRLYILGENNLDLVDAATLTQLGTIPFSALKLNLAGQAFGAGIEVSPDGSKLYATTTSTTIIGLDTAKLEQVVLGKATLTPADVTTFTVTSPAAAIAVAPDGSRLYANVPGSPGKVTVFDTAGGPSFDITVGNDPRPIGLTPDGSLAVVGNTGDNTLSLVNTTTREASSIPVGGVPTAVAISPNGQRGFVATGATSAARTANTVTAIDLTRRAASASPVPLAAAPAAMAINPQGDRVYVVPASSLTGELRIAASTGLTFIPLGVRLPTEWFLTSGQILPGCLNDPPPAGLAVAFGQRTATDIQPNSTATALSQVIPAAGGCKYAFSFWGLAADTGAVAEVFWLGSNCAAARTDQVAIQVIKDTRGVHLALHRAQLTAPAGATQAEVRFSTPPEVLAAVARTSLMATFEGLANGDLQVQAEDGSLANWTQASQASSHLLVGTSNGSKLLKNPGSATAELVQALSVNSGKNLMLQVEGRAVSLTSIQGHPSVGVHWLAADGSETGPKLAVDVLPGDFGQHPASETTPAGTTQAQVHLVLPGGTALAVNQISLKAQDLTSVPLSFVAQAPGELRVSGATVPYDTVPAVPAPIPAKGLCTPTPPDRKPGEPPCETAFCPCCRGEQTMTQPSPAVTAAGRPVTVGRCANCGTVIVRGGGSVVTGAPTISVTRFPIISHAPAVVIERPVSPAMPALTAIPGIGPGRILQLNAIGIKSIANLAAAAPETVAHGLKGVSLKNAAGYIEHARRIVTALAPPIPIIARMFPPAGPADPSPAGAPTAPFSLHPLSGVAGIGPARVRSLAGIGITALEQLAQAAPADVARALKGAGVSPSSAAALVAKARSLIAIDKQS